MTTFNPWSLERLLATSHQGEAISGTIDARNQKYEVLLKTKRRPEQEDFTYLQAEIQMRRPKENLFSAQQVYQLASQYGGEKSLRLMLENYHDRVPRQFFDININGKEIQRDKPVRTFRLPPGEFTPRPLLRDLCKILNLQYEENEEGFYLPREQDPRITPDTVREAYRRMKRSDYFPSISNSCAGEYNGFELFQFPIPEGVHQTLFVNVGALGLSHIPISKPEMMRFQHTLLTYCPALPKLNYRWRTETAKDMEGYEYAGSL